MLISCMAVVRGAVALSSISQSLAPLERSISKDRLAHFLLPLVLVSTSISEIRKNHANEATHLSVLSQTS